jgi:hypothetical protein
MLDCETNLALSSCAEVAATQALHFERGFAVPLPL